MAKLTDKQQRFIEEYLLDCNATQAAIRAGYSEKTANEQGARLLANVSIREEVDKRLNKRSEKVELSAEWVLNNLREVAERCMVATPVLDREGESTGEYRFEHSGANKALELIGKHLGMFKEKVEVEHSGEMNHNVQVEHDLSKLSVEELKQLESIVSKAAPED